MYTDCKHHPPTPFEHWHRQFAHLQKFLTIQLLWFFKISGLCIYSLYLFCFFRNNLEINQGMLLSNMVICRFNFMFHHCPWSLVKLFKLASMWGNVQYKSCCYYHGNEKISFRKKKSPSCMVLSLNLIMLIILLLHFLLMSLAHSNFSRKVSRKAKPCPFIWSFWRCIIGLFFFSQVHRGLCQSCRKFSTSQRINIFHGLQQEIKNGHQIWQQVSSSFYLRMSWMLY